MNANIVYLVIGGGIIVGLVFLLKKKKVVKESDPIPSKPYVVEEVKPAVLHPHLVAPSTRAFLNPDRPTYGPTVAIDYSGWELKNSGFPKVNPVRANEWATFMVYVEKPSQMIQASAQNATMLDEEIAGVSRHRQSSNPTALNLKLAPGVYPYKVRCDRDADLVVKYTEY